MRAGGNFGRRGEFAEGRRLGKQDSGKPQLGGVPAATAAAWESSRPKPAFGFGGETVGARFATGFRKPGQT
jgi:hypothetical protein